MARRNRTCAAVVVRAGLSWFARPGADPWFLVTPEWAREDVTRVANAAALQWFPDGGEGTVLWQAGKAPDMRPVVDAMRERGWRVSDSGHETGWYSIRRDDGATVHLGIGPMISQARTSVTTLTDEAATVAGRLARYAELTGAAWCGTAGLSGCAAIRNLHESKTRGGVPLWRWDKAPDELVASGWELRGSRNFRRMTPDEEACRYVHHFDVRAMYLAAANVAMVGWSAPVERGPQEFDGARPGYWKVRAADVADAPVEVVRDGGDWRWLTTPVMAYLAELGITPEVHASWTSDRGGRYLKPWAELLTAALVTERGGDLEDAVKDTYARTVGMMRKEGGRIYRPDWRDELVDRARVNAVRKVRASGYVPLRWHVDSVWIATDDEAATVGRRLGSPYDEAGAEVWQVGKFRHVDTMTPQQYLGSYEVRREANRA